MDPFTIAMLLGGGSMLAGSALNYFGNKEQADAAAKAQQAQLAAMNEQAYQQSLYGGYGADLIGLGGNQAQQSLYNGFQGSLAGILGGMPLQMPSAPGSYAPWRPTLSDMYSQYEETARHAGDNTAIGSWIAQNPGLAESLGLTQVYAGQGGVFDGSGATIAPGSSVALRDALPDAPTTSATGSRTATGGVSTTSPAYPTALPAGIAPTQTAAPVVTADGSRTATGGTAGAGGLGSMFGTSGQPGAQVGFDPNQIGFAGASSALGAGYGGAIGALDYNRLASGFQTDPGYEWARQQGEQTINRSAAARGGLDSGATLKALSDYNQGLASQQFGNYMDRASGLAGQQSGLMAGYGSNLANLATNTGTQVSNLYGNYGSNLGGLQTGTANNMANVLTGAAANNANMIGGNLGVYSSTVPYAGQGLASLGNMAGQAGQLGLMAGMSGGGDGQAWADYGNTYFR